MPSATKVSAAPVAAVELVTIAERCGELHRSIEGSKGSREEIRTLLLQAKKDVGHGNFVKWLDDNKGALGFGVRQARVYMMPNEQHGAYMAEHAKRQRDVRTAASKHRAASKAQEAQEAEEDDSVETEAVASPVHPHEAAVAKMVRRVAAAARDDLDLDLDNLGKLAEERKLTLDQVERLRDSIDAACRHLVPLWSHRAKAWGVGRPAVRALK